MINYPINGKYLNAIHHKYLKCGVYDEINRQLLNKYLSKGRETKLKHLPGKNEQTRSS